MKNNWALKKIRDLQNYIKATPKLLSARFLVTRTQTRQETAKFKFENPQSMAYHLIGEKTASIMPLFQDLDLKLQRSGLKVKAKNTLRT